MLIPEENLKTAGLHIRDPNQGPTPTMGTTDPRYTAWPKNGQNLNLTNRKDTSLLLVDQCMMTVFVS